MRTEDGNPLWPASQKVESMDYAGYAELLGFQGIQVRNDDEVTKNTGMALLKGDPEGLEVMRDTAKAVFTEGVERVKGSLHLGHEK